jgi:hypothetical protein
MKIFAEIRPRQDICGDPIVTECIERSTYEHSGKSDERIKSPRGDRSDSGAGAVSVDDHADPEEQGTQYDREHCRGLDVEIGEILSVEQPYADATDDNRGEHHF